MHLRPRNIALLTFLAVIASALANHDMPMVQRQRVDSLERALRMAPNAIDSLRLLYDIYDSDTYAHGRKNLLRLYYASLKTNDTLARLDILRNMAKMYTGNDSMQSVLQHRAELMPVSPQQKETVTYIKLARAGTAASILNEEERMEQLHSTLADFGNDLKVDLYRRIEMLFTICMYMRDRSNSKLLLNYLRQLGELINHMPHRSGMIRTAYYETAAIAATATEHRHQAINADRLLLATIAERESIDHQNGRQFRDYDNYYYSAYQRMLINYKALGADSLKIVHDQLADIARRDPELARQMQERSVAYAYYAMATKNYAKALPLLWRAYNNHGNNSFKILILREIIDAAQATGNTDDLLRAYKDYSAMLDWRSKASDADRILEYQILNDVQALRADNAQLVALNQQEVIESQRRAAWFFAIIAVVVLLTAVILLLAYRRARRMTARLGVANATLRGERDKLMQTQAQLVYARDRARDANRQKTDFINTICHEIQEPVNAIVGYSQLIIDAADDNHRRIYDNFVKIIELNSMLLRRIINDVLDVAELEGSQVVVKNSNIAVADLCKIAAEQVRPQLADGVTMTVEPATPADVDVTVDTDVPRAEQVLVNLLTNAAKFTDKGSVSVQYGFDATVDRVYVTITDTGPGVPPEKADVIFDPFEKLSHTSQGVGLGLHICRLVAHLLGGNVILDQSYTDGARFIFTLPVKAKGKATHIVPLD